MFDGTKRILLGWIPLTASQPGSQYWGGHLAFPREIYQLPNGFLRTRLESSFSQRIRGELLFPGEYSKLSAQTGSWEISENNATWSTPTQTGVALISAQYDKVDMTVNISLEPGAIDGGIILDWSSNGPGYEVGIDEVNNRFVIKTSNGTVHSELPIESMVGRQVELRVILEEDIVEAFLDDQYSLAARIPEKIQLARMGIYSNGGAVGFTDLKLYHLNRLEDIDAELTAVPHWLIY